MTTEATAILDGGGGIAQAAPAANAGVAAPASNGSQPAANGHWLAGADWTDDDRAYAANKGWDKLPSAVPKPVFESYRNLEKVMGGKANAVLLPRPDDAAGKVELMQKLGMPMEAKDYKLPATIPPDKAQNLNPKLVEQYQGWAHKAHLTNEQFGTLLAEHEAAVERAEAEADQRWDSEKARTVEKLRTELGDQFGEQVARGNQLIIQGFMTRENASALAEVMGHEGATRMMMKLGGMLAQHKAVGLDNGGRPADGFVTDRARAASRIQAIKMLAGNATGPDADFKKAMLDPGHPEHKNVTAQWREWQRVANS